MSENTVSKNTVPENTVSKKSASQKRKSPKRCFGVLWFCSVKSAFTSKGVTHRLLVSDPRAIRFEHCFRLRCDIRHRFPFLRRRCPPKSTREKENQNGIRSNGAEQHRLRSYVAEQRGTRSNGAELSKNKFLKTRCAVAPTHWSESEAFSRYRENPVPTNTMSKNIMSENTIPETPRLKNRQVKNE